MKSNLIAATVVAVAGLFSVAASAEPLNAFLLEAMQMPSTKTRAEVKSEMLQARKADAASSYDSATAQHNLTAPRAEKPSAAPQPSAEVVKTSQQ